MLPRRRSILRISLCSFPFHSCPSLCSGVLASAVLRDPAWIICWGSHPCPYPSARGLGTGGRTPLAAPTFSRRWRERQAWKPTRQVAVCALAFFTALSHSRHLPFSTLTSSLQCGSSVFSSIGISGRLRRMCCLRETGSGMYCLQTTQCLAR